MTSISFREVTKTYTDNGAAPVVDRLSLDVPEGAFLTLLGASGCGKSTLLRMAGDLLTPTSGSVVVNGGPASRAREAHEIGFVFQAPNLCPWRTARRNVELPLEVMKRPKQERRQRAEEMLALVGLPHAIDRYPHELSGGMAQRVAIARALAFDPKIIMLDEPFGALDEITRERLNGELHELWRTTGKTVVFVTHSVPEAVFLSTQIAVLRASPGRVAHLISVDLPDLRTSETRSTREYFDTVNVVRDALVDAGGHG